MTEIKNDLIIAIINDVFKDLSIENMNDLNWHNSRDDKLRKYCDKLKTVLSDIKTYPRVLVENEVPHEFMNLMIYRSCLAYGVDVKIPIGDLEREVKGQYSKRKYAHIECIFLTNNSSYELDGLTERMMASITGIAASPNG